MKIKALFFLAVSVSLLVGSLSAQSDASLRRVIALDKNDRDPAGHLNSHSSGEHLSRAEVYSANRLFPEARAHWQKILDLYPSDPGMAKALFGIARSYMWEREYAKAVFWFDRLTKDHLDTKDGREGLAFKGASYVRLGRNLDAAKTYEQYATLFPDGERIESSYLNIIDAYREAEKYEEANEWVDRTRVKFAGKPAATNALHARLRMEIYRGSWNAAGKTADELLRANNFLGTMTSGDEVEYLKALALEKDGKLAEALAVYSSIPNSAGSYFGGLAAEHIRLSGGKPDPLSSISASSYPVMYRADLLKYAGQNKIDPRFLLAIMKQESTFKSNAKSPAGARGLLQLVFDTAIKYKDIAGYPTLTPDMLYSPSVNIAIGSAYVGHLKGEFGWFYEAIAASYNGGEDNAARWMTRTKPAIQGVFAAEIGFAETKNYVFKVMNNYRVSRELYTEDLRRR
ncbi:MAG: transglycosylase SLT domain-containing protein [Pyrinomonadaceae bacterium]